MKNIEEADDKREKSDYNKIYVHKSKGEMRNGRHTAALLICFYNKCSKKILNALKKKILAEGVRGGERGGRVR